MSVPRRQIWLLIAAAGCAVSAALVYLGVTLSSRVQFVDAAADHGVIGQRRPTRVVDLNQFRALLQPPA